MHIAIFVQVKPFLLNQKCGSADVTQGNELFTQVKVKLVQIFV